MCCCVDLILGLELKPLLFEPGKPGFYSPRVGSKSSRRLSWFRLIGIPLKGPLPCADLLLGRLVGLCLMHNEILPLVFNRHVAKYLLGRDVRWHDMAFFDPEMYESMRKMIVEASRMTPDAFASLCLTFNVSLTLEFNANDVDS